MGMQLNSAHDFTEATAGNSARLGGGLFSCRLIARRLLHRLVGLRERLLLMAAFSSRLLSHLRGVFREDAFDYALNLKVFRSFELFDNFLHVALKNKLSKSTVGF